MVKPLDVVVVGLGSMGSRRLRCLKALGHRVALGVDPRADRRRRAEREHGIVTHETVTPSVLAQADAVVISTPPFVHTPYIAMALQARRPCFVEASVMVSDLPKLWTKAKVQETLVWPSCTMRYFRGPQLVADLVSKKTAGKPWSFIYHSGQFLPDWHPWEKVSDYYVSRPETGGGREIVPFELAWLTGIFGRVIGVKAQQAIKARFARGVEDLYQSLLEFESGVHGMLQVDILARVPVRRFALEGDAGRLVWDQYHASGAHVLVEKPGAAPRRLPVIEPKPARGINSDGPYIAELSDFLADVRARRWKPRYTLGDDVDILRTLERIRDHCDERPL